MDSDNQAFGHPFVDLKLAVKGLGIAVAPGHTNMRIGPTGWIKVGTCDVCFLEW